MEISLICFKMYVKICLFIKSEYYNIIKFLFHTILGWYYEQLFFYDWIVQHLTMAINAKQCTNKWNICLKCTLNA